MKKTCLVFAFLLAFATSYCQTVDNFKIVHTNLFKLQVKYQDTICCYTQLLSDRGEFSFINGFSKENTPPDESWAITRHKVKYTFKADSMVTLNSFFPFDKNDNQFSYGYEPLFYTYILTQLKEKILYNSSSNFIRHVYVSGNDLTGQEYNSIELRFIHDSIMVYSKMGVSTDNRGVRLIKNDSCLLKKKDKKEVCNYLKKYSLSGVNIKYDCKAYSYYSILEVYIDNKYSYYILSDDLKCKTVLPADLALIIQSINIRYFKRNWAY